MNPWNPFILVQGHEAQKQVGVGLQTDRNIDTSCVSQLRWVFPEADAAADRRFLRAWSYQQAAKNIAGVGHGTLVSAGFF